MAKIISANYRNRKSEYKWLVRDEMDPVHDAIAYKSVTANGVAFRQADQEIGFGCSMVAIAREATGTDAERAPIKLKTIGLKFVVASFVSDGQTITEVNTLTLGADGSMIATVPN
jgi:hypothetical protein